MVVRVRGVFGLGLRWVCVGVDDLIGSWKVRKMMSMRSYHEGW